MQLGQVGYFLAGFLAVRPIDLELIQPVLDNVPGHIASQPVSVVFLEAVQVFLHLVYVLPAQSIYAVSCIRPLLVVRRKLVHQVLDRDVLAL